MKIPAWTYSQLDKFETCPKQFFHVRVVKDVTEPPTTATIWGERVHSAFEERIKNNTPLPNGMQQWETFAARLHKLPGDKHCELQMAVDQNFEPAPWGEAWTRGIADLFVVHGSSAFVLDYKTGRRKLTDQLTLYAGYVFSHYAEVKTVTTGFVWLKDRKIDMEAFSRDQVPAIWRGFLPRVERLERAYKNQIWPPRPSGLCRGWCAVKSCEFYKTK